MYRLYMLLTFIVCVFLAVRADSAEMNKSRPARPGPGAWWHEFITNHPILYGHFVFDIKGEKRKENIFKDEL